MSLEFFQPFEEDEEAAKAEAEAAAAAARSRQHERLREILEDDDEDEEKAEKAKKDKPEEEDGFFARFKGKLPGLEVDHEEEEPSPAEQAVVLPFVRPGETEEEPYVHPIDVEPTIVEPENPLGESDELTSAEDFEPSPELIPTPPVDTVAEDEPETESEAEAEPDLPEEPDKPVELSPAPPAEASVADIEPDEPEIPTPPIPPTPPVPASPVGGSSAGSGGGTPSIPGGRPPVPIPSGESSPDAGQDMDDFATHREVNRKATIAGIAGAAGGAWLGAAKARKMDAAAEDRALEREEAIEKRVEAHDRALAARQARLEEEQEALRLKHEKQERQRRLETADQAQKQRETQAEIAQTERAPKPQPLQERYSPDVHDRIPPQEAFRELTGMEQPKPRTLEQERRHEVKDNPSQVPVSYTQVDPTSPWNHTAQSGPQASRSTLMNIGGPVATPLQPTPQPSKSGIDPTIKKAAISGVITGAVILAALIVFALLR